MAPQSSKKYGLLPPDHHIVSVSVPARAMTSIRKQVPGTISVLTISSLTPQGSVQSEERFITPFPFFDPHRSEMSVYENIHFGHKNEIMKPYDTPIAAGIRRALFLIGTGVLTTLVSTLEVSQAGATRAVVTDLSSQESAPLDRTAREAIGRSQLQTRTIVRVRHVKLDVNSILNEPSIRIKFFPDVSLDVIRDKVTQTTDGTRNWVGHVRTNKIHRAIFVIKGGKVVGTVHNGIHVYQIRPVQSSTGGIHAIYEIDQTRFPSERAHGRPPRRPPISSNTSPGEIGSHAPALSFLHSSTFPITTVSLPGSTQVDLLVVYGDDVKNAAGANIDMEILQAVSATNQTLEDSGIALFLCLVDRVYVQGYGGTGDVEKDLNCLLQIDGTCLYSGSSVTPAVLDIWSRRQTMNADLVNVWVETGNDCGWAYPNDGTPMEDILGFSVVNRSGPTCATSNYSMAHELGHSMGTRHDRASEEAPNSNGQQNYGHFNVNANQRTIMATQDFCPMCARIGIWSNLLSSLSYSNGATPMGSANPSNAANNAGTLEINKDFVRDWRTPTSTTCKNATATDTTPPSTPTSLSVQ